jgi:halimadienyl-diphosphate synthase
MLNSQKAFSHLNKLITNHTEALLGNLGKTYTEDSVAYDTAWAARLAPCYPGQGFEAAIFWLRKNQHPDGSWGSAAVHYHDRIINTLAAINALKLVGNADQGDSGRIAAGQQYLWKHYRRLNWDSNDTVNYTGLSSMLTQEAETLGLSVPSDLSPKRSATERKLERLRANPERWQGHPLIMSLEWLRLGFPEGARFVEDNGSIGASPAATAAFLLNSSVEIPKSIAYLQSVALPDGGFPDFEPLDIFDIAWTLKHLISVNAVTPDHPEVRRCLEFLWGHWSPTKGVGCTTYAKDVVDLDDTAVTFAVLKWGGYPVDAAVFAEYEREDHFCCYVDEADQSLSVHIRTLAALSLAETTPQIAKWREKIATCLWGWHDTGRFKSDKWHASQYYLSALATQYLYADFRDIVEPHVRWIMNTQQPDGGWGDFGFTTPEETAYGLLALLYWNKIEMVAPHHILDAMQYLYHTLDSIDYVPLWIAKTLHTPAHIVQAAVLSALHMAQASVKG